MQRLVVSHMATNLHISAHAKMPKPCSHADTKNEAVTPLASLRRSARWCRVLVASNMPLSEACLLLGHIPRVVDRESVKVRWRVAPRRLQSALHRPAFFGTCTLARRQRQSPACDPLEDDAQCEHAAAVDAGDDEPIWTAAGDDLDNVNGIAESNGCFSEHCAIVSNDQSGYAAQ